MRAILFAAVLILAACGTATPTPTATVVPPTAAPTGAPVATGESLLGALAATVPVPEAGTLMVPSNLETINPPTPAPVTIDQLNFTQSGGLAGTTLTIILRGDGTLIRDGQTSAATPEQVQKIASLLDSIHFFEMNGIFTGANASADTYRYTVTIVSAGRRRTITSQDGLTPPELYEVYDAIRTLGGA